MAKAKKDRFGLRGEVHFQMAPLIDVVFLLLIFFITVTTFYEAENVDVMLAYAKTAEKFKKGDDTLVVNVTRDGDIVVEGQKFLKEALQAFMQDLMGNPDMPTSYRVAIRADGKARMKEVKEVYRAAARAGLTRISLVTQTRESEKAGLGPAAPKEEEEISEEELIY